MKYPKVLPSNHQFFSEYVFWFPKNPQAPLTEPVKLTGVLLGPQNSSFLGVRILKVLNLGLGRCNSPTLVQRNVFECWLDDYSHLHSGFGNTYCIQEQFLNQHKRNRVILKQAKSGDCFSTNFPTTESFMIVESNHL